MRHASLEHARAQRLKQEVAQETPHAQIDIACASHLGGTSGVGWIHALVPAAPSLLPRAMQGNPRAWHVCRMQQRLHEQACLFPIEHPADMESDLR